MTAEYHVLERLINDREDLPECVREFLLWYIRTEPVTVRCSERRRRYAKEAKFLLETMKPHNLELALEVRRDLGLRPTLIPQHLR